MEHELFEEAEWYYGECSMCGDDCLLRDGLCSDCYAREVTADEDWESLT